MSQPLVTVYDPLTWEHGWSYDIEKQILEAAKADFVVPEGPEERDTLVESADLIISSSLVFIDRNLINSFKNCAAILCYSSGKDAIDVEAAHDAGISVANVQANTLEVTEHAMALLLALTRQVVPLADATNTGTWDLRDLPDVWTIPVLSGATAGIIGAGRVGRAVAERCRAFGMRTIATYHNPPAEPDQDLAHVSLDELLQTSDFVIVCASLNPDSSKMLNTESLANVKRGARLINVSRGPVIDEAALVEALDDKRLAGVALDVRDPEPPASPDPLANRPNVIQTPHMAGASSSVRARLQEMAAHKALEMLEAAGQLSNPPRRTE